MNRSLSSSSSSSATTTVPMIRSPSLSPPTPPKPDSWGWDKPYPDEFYHSSTKSPNRPVSMKKKKRSPLGKLKVYEQFNKMNKDKFAKASPTGKRNLLDEYQVNPRNTDSSSYAVPGINPNMYAYYNTLADKYKKRVLEVPEGERQEMLNWYHGLEHNRHKPEWKNRTNKFKI